MVGGLNIHLTHYTVGHVIRFRDLTVKSIEWLGTEVLIHHTDDSTEEINRNHIVTLQVYPIQ